MATRSLNTAIGTYPHTRPLKDGTVEPKDLSLEHVEVTPIINVFRRMIRATEFDVSEMALSTYLCARSFDKPIVAIPVFPVRSFVHGAISYNTKSGIEEPGDLSGRKVGVRAYTVTTGAWARGVLQAEYGVDPASVTWVVVDDEHVTEYQSPPNVQRAEAGKTLEGMLAEGEIDAAIGAGRSDAPEIKPLVPSAQTAAVDYFRKSGVYPINHTIVIKREILESDPSVAEDLFDAFKRAKKMVVDGLGTDSVASSDEEEITRLRTLLGGDHIPYGVAANRTTIESMIRFAVQQKIIPSAPRVEDLFATNTLNLEG